MARETAVPAWQRLLERPRRLHRLATGGLLLAAVVAGVDAYVRATPGGGAPEVLALTYLFDALAWALMAASACGEAYVAGLSAPRARADGRPHYLIVLVVGLVIAGILCLTLSFFAAASPAELGTSGRTVKAVIAGMLPLIVGVALAAGLTLLWVSRLRPRLEARLEAQLEAQRREYEERRAQQ